MSITNQSHTLLPSVSIRLGKPWLAHIKRNAAAFRWCNNHSKEWGPGPVKTIALSPVRVIQGTSPRQSK